ncbi:hypothetical protein BH11CYA1_BH11CYA1_49500 [soil metagenome]
MKNSDTSDQDYADDDAKTRLSESNELNFAALDNYELSPGDLIGDYEVIRLIGVGGMGYVYEARHQILHKVYAVKTIRAEQLTETVWRRMQIEAQAIARMNHPNIVGIHNFGIENGRPFYVMDLLKGTSLAQKLASRGSLPLKETLEIFTEVALGLNYAHKKGIIHRDIKPGNIILLKSADSTGAKVKVVDFGIAKLAGTADPNNQNITSMGEIFGSPLYMSPEQCLSERCDARSDVYALGCTLFETLTGQPPFRGSNAMQTMMMHQGEPAPTLAEKASKSQHFPEALDMVLAKMLAKKPRERYQNLAAVVEDLEEISADLTSSKVDGNSGQLRSNIAVIVVAISVGTLLVAALAVLAIGGSTNLPSLTRLFVGREDLSTSKVESKSSADNATLPNVNKVAQSVITSPVCSYVRKGKEVIKVFQFPKVSLGLIHSESKGRGDWRASGRLEFPIETKLVFTSYSTMMTHPENFRAFKNGDFYGIALRYIADGKAPDNDAFIPSPKPIMSDITAALKNMSHLDKLNSLSLANCTQLKDSDIRILGQFTNLNHLDLSATNANGTEVAKLPYMKQLINIDFTSCRQITPLLKAMAGSKKMLWFKVNSLSDGALTKEDIGYLATMPNLEILEIGGPGANNEAIEALCKLPKLIQFTSVDGAIDERAIKSFKKMKALKSVAIQSRMWTSACQQKLNAALLK